MSQREVKSNTDFGQSFQIFFSPVTFDIRVETDLFYGESIVVVLLSSQDLSEEMSSFNFHCQVPGEALQEYFQGNKQVTSRCILYLIRDC